MKKIIFLTTALICSILIIIVITLKDNEKNYNYTFEIKTEITNDKVKELERKIEVIYEYFDSNNFEIDDAKYIISTFTKFEKENNTIFIDGENISDFQLIQLILQFVFSENVHYGLMYGVMYDISSIYNLEFEIVRPFSMDEIEKCWEYISLAYINFIPEIASETEIEISKYVSVELVKYIKSQYGREFLSNLMKDSCDVYKVHRVSEILEEWMKQENDDYTSNKVVHVEVFNQNYENNILQYMTKNINWTLDLDKKECLSDYFTSINDNTKVFYEYMNLFYNEIARLEDVFHFKSSEVPMLTVQIYPNDGSKTVGRGGIYYDGNNLMKLYQIITFSHEYIHFLDFSLGTYPKYAALGEMRAVYYSTDFELTNLTLNEMFIKDRDMMIKEFGETPFLETEKFLGRTLTHKDYNLLFADIYVHEMLEAGNEMPNLYEVSRENLYPIHHWMSLMNYLIKTYGNEALDTIMLEEKLPDGSPKTMPQVIEEWKVYITNFSEKDYGKYYH